MSFPRHRPRRLRSTPAMRRLVAQTSLEPRHLVLPMFVADGVSEPRPIASMPGVERLSVKAAGSSVQVNQTAAGRIPEGAVVERTVDSKLARFASPPCMFYVPSIFQSSGDVFLDSRQM